LKDKFGDKLRIAAGVDLMKAETFGPAIEGCVGVFHTASPFTYETDNPMEDLVKPAKIGTVACLEACKKVGGVKRVIVTSSVVSCVPFGGKIVPGTTFSSQDWNAQMSPQADGTIADSNVGYSYSKANAEKSAWDFQAADDCSFDIACICPPMIIGRNTNKPASEKDLNTSSALLMKVLRGELPTQPGSVGWVDVENVAGSHIAAYVRPEAGGRRFLLGNAVTWVDTAKMLKEIRPDLPVKTDPPADGEGDTWFIDNSALKIIGVELRPLIETFKLQADSLAALGYLPAEP